MVDSTHSRERSFRLRLRLTPELSWEPQWPRGRYLVQGQWQLADDFGFWRLTVKATWSTGFVVPAASAPFRPPTLGARLTGSAPKLRPVQRKGDPFDVRRYAPGDDLRRFHWSLYAHSGIPYVRTADPSPPPSGYHAFVVDVESASEADLDHRLGCLVTWIEALERAGSRWSVSIPARSGLLTFRDNAAERLAELTPAPWPVGSAPFGSIESPILITAPHSRAVQGLRQSKEKVRFLVVEIPVVPREPLPHRPWWSRG